MIGKPSHYLLAGCHMYKLASLDRHHVNLSQFLSLLSWIFQMDLSVLGTLALADSY